MAISGSSPITIYKPDGSLQTRIYGRVVWEIHKILPNRDFQFELRLEFWKASGTTASNDVQVVGGYTFDLWKDSGTKPFDQGKFNIPGGGGVGTGFSTIWGGVLSRNSSNLVRFRSVNAQISGSTVMKNISFDFTADMTLPGGFSGNVANFNDTQNPVIPINNPSGLNCAIYVEFVTGGRTYYTSQKSGNFTVPFTTSDREHWYELNPTKSTVPFKFVMTSTVPGFAGTSQEKTATMTIANANPAFTSFELSDNGSVMSILGNAPNTFINQISDITVKVSAANKMIFKKGATGSGAKYISTFLTNNVTGNYDDSGDVVMKFPRFNLPSGQTGSGTVTVRAYDSRGNSVGVSKTVTIIDWRYAEANVDVKRTTPFATTAALSVKGSYSKINYGGVNKNTVQAVHYRYRPSGGTFSGWTAMQFTVNASAGTFQCTNVTLSGLVTDREYDVEVRVTDVVSAGSITKTVIQKGKPLAFIGKNGDGSVLSVGKIPSGGLPDGSVDAAGGYYTDKGVHIKAIGSSWINGRTTTNVLQFNNVNSNGSFYPLIRFKNNNLTAKDIGTIGSLNSNFGFFGLSSASTANERTSQAYLDMATNTWICSSVSKNYGSYPVPGTQSGTWTPTAAVGFSSFSVVAGSAKYYRIGRFIFVVADFNTTLNGNGIQIGGLPFPADGKGIACSNWNHKGAYAGWSVSGNSIHYWGAAVSSGTCNFGMSASYITSSAI